MTAQMAGRKYVGKVPNTTNPIIEHNLGDFFVSAVTVQTVATDDHDATTIETRTTAIPTYSVLDRDRIQLTLSTSAAERWIVIQA